MQKSTINWNDISIFLNIVRYGSARATATELNVSHSTVTRRLSDLETQLGVMLFRKNVSGHQLTEDGEMLLGYAEQAETHFLQAESQLKGKDAKYSGEIRITTADAIANHLLMPTMVKFRKDYPEIDIEVVLSSQVLDLGNNEVDLSLRFLPIDQMPPDDLIGRIVGKVALCYYATSEYLIEHDPWANNTSAELIGWGELGRHPEWLQYSPLKHLPTTCRLNHAALQVEACCQGLGIAALPCFIADNVQELQRVSGCEPEIKHDIWLLSSPEKRDVARLKVFKERIVDDFENNKEKLLGR